MKYYYSNGYVMSDHVAMALKYLGKVGVLSSYDWHHYFCYNKDRRWQERQLSYLKNYGYIKKHPANSLLGRWIIDETGKDFLCKIECPIVNPVSAHHIDHDEFVARSLFTMEQSHYIQSWKVERELKMMNQREYMVTNKDNIAKYPDAVFKVQLPDGIRTVALEYERRGKSETRYRSILWNYSKLPTISLVIFICEEEIFSKRIEKALSNIGKTDLHDRLALTSAHEWKNSPLEASIRMAKGSIFLKNVCQEFQVKLAV